MAHGAQDEYSDEVQDLGFHIPLKEGWEITPKAFQVLRDLQPRLRALGPPQDGLLLLDSKELQDASEADLQAVTTAATSLISKGPGEEGALAASRSLVSAEPLKPGHVAYDDTRTSYGMFAKTDLPALTPICMYGGRITTVEESDAEQNKQLQPQPGRQGQPIVKSHLFSLPTFEEEEESRCLVVDAAPIHRRPGAMSDGIDRFLGGLANAPESDDVEANMVTLPFLGAGSCGACALLKLRGEDGTLSPLAGEDADLILPLLVLVTTTAVRSTEELTLYYGPEYFPVLAEVCEDAAAVKREEQRIAAAGASSAAAGPSNAVQPAGNSAGGGGDGGVGAKAKGRGPFWSKMEWIKPLVHPPPPRVSEDLMQMDHECATNATMDDVKQGIAIRLGGERPNGRTLFNIDVFIAAEQRAMVMLNKGVDFGKGLGSAFAGDILRYLHVHKSCPGMESDTACEVAFNKKFWRLAKLGPLEEYWSVQTDKIYELWERERQAAIAAGRPPPYSDAFYKERLEPALARAAVGPAPGLAAGSSSADEEAPGEQSDDDSAPGFTTVEGDDESGEMDDNSFGFGGGDVDDIVQGGDQTPVSMAVDAQMAEEAPAPEAAAPIPVAVQAVAAEEPAAEAVATVPVPAAIELPVGQDGDVLGDMNALNAQLADAKTQCDVFAQTAHARQGALAAAAQAARQQADEAMQLALAAQQEADGADAALAATKAADEARMDELRALARRLTGVKRKREAEAEAEDAERKLAAEQQNLAAALAAVEAAKAVAEAAREKLLHGGSQDTD